MKFSLDAAPGSLIVTGYEAGGIIVRGRLHTPPLVLTPDSVRELANLPSLEALTVPILEDIARHGVEIILVGTGPRHVLLPLALMRDAAACGIGMEVMSTPAACRSYNVLVSEHRAVALLLPA